MLDTNGLICAFLLDPVGQLARLPVPPEVFPPGHYWLHFNLADGRARRYIEECTVLPEEPRAVLLEADSRIRLQVFPAGFVVVLGDLHHDFDADLEGFGSLRVYVDSQVIISGRVHPLRSVDRLRRDLQRSVESESPMDVFEQLIERLAETIGGVAAQLSETVEAAEDEGLSGGELARSHELGQVRRLLARLRRQVNANRNALLPLATRLKGVVSARESKGLRDALDHLNAVGQDLELVIERARLLQEEFQRRQREATNRNLYALSIVTTVMLPITLITGIFGMNLGDLPFRSGDRSFWWVLALMAATFLATHLRLRRARPG